MLRHQAGRATQTFHSYPRTFWILVLVIMIDRLGGSLIYPFFALYLTGRFEVGMSQVGLLFAVFSVASFAGSIIGGALTDRLGRRWMIITSLIATSLSAVAFGLVSSVGIFFVIAMVTGLFTEAGGPAYNAVVADVLPEEKRAEGFALIRVAFNISAAIGPLIGGLLASRSYLGLFIADAGISLVAAGIVFALIPETKPVPAPGEQAETTRESFSGYRRVLRDSSFMLFIGVCMLAWLTYTNMFTTLGVYLRDQHGTPESAYGVILALNAAMVVLLQFWTTRRAERYPPMLMMALGTILYGIGFGMYGIVSSLAAFLFAMVIVTFGEMITVPISNATVVNMAPTDMRGRYSAVFGISWGIPFAVGPYLAGLLMDNYNPDWLWYACAVIAAVAAVGFAYLNRRTHLGPARVAQEAG
jgi:MFS family permease